MTVRGRAVPYQPGTANRFCVRLLSATVLEIVFVLFDHLLHRDTRTTSEFCTELIKPFFSAFSRKYLDLKLR